MARGVYVPSVWQDDRDKPEARRVLQQNEKPSQSEALAAAGQRNNSAVHYHFGGRDARKAMVEETWDVFLKGLDSAPIPRGAWRTPNGYVPLPINNVHFSSALE